MKKTCKKVDFESLFRRIDPKYYFIIAFILAGLTLYLILSYSQLLSTGKYIIMDGDAIEIYVPFIRMLMRDIREGQSIWYSWSTSMGMNTSLTNSFYAMSPLNIIYILCPYVDETVITAVLVIFKASLAAAAFQLFARVVLKCEGVESILFSIGYSLCAFQIVYNLINFMWMDALYMLPIICIMIYRLYNNKKWIGLVIAYCYLFISQFYVGYMVGLFSLLFFIILLFMGKNRSWKNLFGIVVRYFFSVLIAVGLSAIVWLPTLLFLISNNPDDATSFMELGISIFDVYNNLFFGQMQLYRSRYPYIYCGIPILLMIPCFFINHKIKMKVKIASLILISFLVIAMIWDPLYRLMHAFDAPDSFGCRFAFLLSFVLSSVACLQARYLDDIKTKMLIAIIIMNIVIYSLMQIIRSDNQNSAFGLLMNAMFFLLWFILYLGFKHGRVRNVPFAVAVIGLIMIECGLNGYCCMHDCVPQYQQTYEIWKNSVNNAMNQMEKDDGVYRVHYENDLIHNSDSWFGYMGLSDFSTAENPRLRKTMSDLGFFTGPRITYQYGNTPITSMLFGVKYRVAGVFPYLNVAENEEPVVLQNSNTLQFGYMVSKDIRQYQFPGNDCYDNMNSLLSCMTNQPVNCFVEIPEDEIEIELHNVELYDCDGMIVKRQTDSGNSAWFSVKVKTAGMPSYMQFCQDISYNDSNSPYISGGEENAISLEGKLSSSYAKHMEPMGEYDTVTVIMPDECIEGRYEKAVFYHYDASILSEVYQDLSQNQMEIDLFQDDYIHAEVIVPQDKTVLFTSIPYDPGWSVTANGVSVKTEAVLGEAFLAVPLTEGTYELEFHYTAPGSREGMLVSGIAVLLLLTGILTDTVRWRRGKDKEKESVSEKSSCTIRG